MAELSKFQQAVKDLDKKYGEGTVIRMGDTERVKAPSISSGSLFLDAALGVGGFPEGRIVEIYGPESSGKTTVCLSTIREAQIKYPEKKAVIVDAEHSLDTYYAENLGVNVDSLHIAQPGYGEQALQIVHDLIKTGECSVVVVDSVAALTPKSEIDGEMGDSNIGKQSRMMSQAMRKLVAVTEETNTLLIFTNQIRMKIGVMYGSPETTPGGEALKFYSSIRVEIRKKNPKDAEEAEGNDVTAKIVKNKVARPFLKSELRIIWGKGIDRESEIFNKAVEFDIIKKGGSWYSYKEEKLGQGEDKVRELLNDNPELWKEIEELTLNKINHEKETK